MSLSNKEERTQRRRRLLRAAASAPVVFTLPSGAVLAAASATCADRTAGEENLVQMSTVEDSWVRYTLDAYRIKPKNGPHVTGIEFNGLYYEVLGDGRVEPIPELGNGAPTLTGGKFYALVDYQAYLENPQSPVLFAYPGVDPVANPVTTSCWSSVTSGLLTGGDIF